METTKRRSDAFSYQAFPFLETQTVPGGSKFNAKKGSILLDNLQTKIIMFGRFAEDNRKKMGLGKPETFDFLGFTHYCSKSKQGYFRVKRKTSHKKFKVKIKDFQQWIKSVRNLHTTKEIFDKVRVKLLGHYRYYGVTDNSRMMSSFRHNILRILFKWLNRRSQRKSFDYGNFNLYLKFNPLPNPKIYVNIYE